MMAFKIPVLFIGITLLVSNLQRYYASRNRLKLLKDRGGRFRQMIVVKFLSFQLSAKLWTTG